MSRGDVAWNKASKTEQFGVRVNGLKKCSAFTKIIVATEDMDSISFNALVGVTRVEADGSGLKLNRNKFKLLLFTELFNLFQHLVTVVNSWI